MASRMREVVSTKQRTGCPTSPSVERRAELASQRAVSTFCNGRVSNGRVKGMPGLSQYLQGYPPVQPEEVNPSRGPTGWVPTRGVGMLYVNLSSQGATGY